MMTAQDNVRTLSHELIEEIRHEPWGVKQRYRVFGMLKDGSIATWENAILVNDNNPALGELRSETSFLYQGLFFRLATTEEIKQLREELKNVND